MKLWKRNAVVAAIALFVCMAVYLNWSYQRDNGGSEDVGKTLGQAALVGGSSDPLLVPETPSLPPDSTEPPEDADPGPEDSEKTGYFASARLNRQEARAGALNLLQSAADGENADESISRDMGDAIQTLADFTVSEAQIENLITAKGYADCIAFLGEDSISVVVAADSDLEAADVARITEIVTGETGYTTDQITIIPARE